MQHLHYCDFAIKVRKGTNNERITSHISLRMLSKLSTDFSDPHDGTVNFGCTNIYRISEILNVTA
jgi:hypothetical protein